MPHTNRRIWGALVVASTVVPQGKLHAQPALRPFEADTVEVWIVEYESRATGHEAERYQAALAKPQRVVWHPRRVVVQHRNALGQWEGRSWLDPGSGSWREADSACRCLHAEELTGLGPLAMVPPEGKFTKKAAGEPILGQKTNLYEAQLRLPAWGGTVRTRLWLAPALATPPDSLGLPADVRLAQGQLGWWLRRELVFEKEDLRVLQQAKSLRRERWSTDRLEPPDWKPVPFDRDRKLKLEAP